MDALADVEALPSYASGYKRAEDLDWYEDHRPHHVPIAVKVLGMSTVVRFDITVEPDSLIPDFLI
jgi:hypothetical protein